MPETGSLDTLCAGRRGVWRGWKCHRSDPHHVGPCALEPRWWLRLFVRPYFTRPFKVGRNR